jgi:hypothetical protein
MPTVSPAFTFTGASGSLAPIALEPGETFTATLDDLSGINQVEWSIESTDDTAVAADYTLTPSGPKGSVVSAVALGDGTAGRLLCTVNNGIDPDTGNPSENMKARAKFHVPIAGLEVGCFDERFESSPTKGTTAIQNSAIRAISRGLTIPTSWEIDPVNGRDSASGEPGYPLADFEALFRRLDRSSVAATTAVNLLSTTDENVAARATFVNGSLLRIISTPTVYCTGTITTSVAWNSGSTQEVNVTVGSLSDGHTASQLVGKMIRITGGARAGNWTFVGRDLGSSVLRCAGWSRTDFGLGTASNGDTFEAIDFTWASGAWSFNGLGDGLFWIENVELAARQSFSAIVKSGSVTVYQSIANGLNANRAGDVYSFGSHLSYGPKVLGTYAVDRTVLRHTSSPIEAFEGGVLFVYDQTLAQGGSVNARGASVIRIFGDLSICNAVEGITVAPGGQVTQDGYFWLRDCTTTIFHLYVQSKWAYATGRAPTHVGSTSPGLGNLGNAALTAMPQTNTTSQCSIVVLE